MTDRYIVTEAGYWGHIFARRGERMVDFVFDTEENRVIAMREKQGGGFVESSDLDMEDVTDSLVNANSDALDNPESWELRRTAELPEWACAPGATPGI